MKITKDLEGKRVKITDIDNEIFEGIVSDYIYPEDNEPEGVAGICIEDCPQRPGDWIGFNEHDIKEIKITEVNNQNGNDTFSPYSPKVMFF